MALLSLPALAQQQDIVPCITDELRDEYFAKHPEAIERVRQDDLAIARIAEKMKRSGAQTACEKVIIPVVFHIIHNNGAENVSNGVLSQAMTNLNDYYNFRNISRSEIREPFRDIAADMKIEFRLAKLDPSGDPTTGIIRVESSLTNDARDNVKSLSYWDSNRYLNIWVVKSIQNSSSSQGTVLGFAYFPWMSTARNQGIVIRSDALIGARGSTLAHEAGHFLNLFHPFQDGCGNNCSTSGDRVCDTPPTAQQNFQCPLTRNSCSNDQGEDKLDMVENIMDYANCATIFSEGQKARALASLQEYPSRRYLVSNLNLTETGVIEEDEVLGEAKADFSVGATNICEGDVVDFSDLSCVIPSSTEYKWFFENGSPSTSSDVNPQVTYNNGGGSFNVKLEVKTESGEVDVLERVNFINVIPEVSDKPAPYTNTMSEGGFPYEGWAVETNDNATKEIWKHVADVGRYEDGSLVYDNYKLGVSDVTHDLNLPAIDLSKAKELRMTFDVAYARRTSNNGDQLQVRFADECNGIYERELHLRAVWDPQGNRPSEALVTTGFDEFYNSGPFIPAADQWRTVEVDLSQYEGVTALLPQIRVTAGGGNNIYIDNINIGGWAVGLDNEMLESSIVIFPNPSQGAFSVRLPSNRQQALNILVYDASGREVINQETRLNKGENNVLVTNGETLSEGFYSVRLSFGGNTFVKKLVVSSR